MTTTSAPKFRFIGTTDESTECDKCGRVELKSTVLMATLDADGNDDSVVYYGSSCAARALANGTKSRAVRDMAASARSMVKNEIGSARRTIATYGTDAAATVDVFIANNSGFHGKDRMTRPEWIALAHKVITAKLAIIRDAELMGF